MAKGVTDKVWWQSDLNWPPEVVHPIQSSAADTQVYDFCSLSSIHQLQLRLSDCIDDVACWMRSNRPQLNTPKQTFCGAPQNDAFRSDTHWLQLRHTVVVFSSQSWYLPGFARQHADPCHPDHVQILWHAPSIASLVLSGLDYGNATLAGLPAYLLNQLQAVMNAGTRLIFNVDRREHITPSTLHVPLASCPRSDYF